MKRRNALITNKTKKARQWRARHEKYRNSDLGKYTKARANALARGIEWHFDLASWLKVWKDSGHYAERGRGPGSYQMARFGDCGPYADWNVAIVRMESNAVAAFILGQGREPPLTGALKDEVKILL